MPSPFTAPDHHDANTNLDCGIRHEFTNHGPSHARMVSLYEAWPSHAQAINHAPAHRQLPLPGLLYAERCMGQAIQLSIGRNLPFSAWTHFSTLKTRD